MELVIPISAVEQFANFPRQGALIHCDGTWSGNAHSVTGIRKRRQADNGQHQLQGKPVGRWTVPSTQATLLARHLREERPAYPQFALR